MKGHETLIAMRLKHRAPLSVWITVTERDRTWRDWPLWTLTGNAHLWIEPNDAPHRLDLRCLTGLQCWVDGDDADRVLAVHQACIDVKASRVLTAIAGLDARGRPSIVRMLDTAGVCVLEAS